MRAASGSLVVFACEINAFLFRSELNASLHKETAIYSFILLGGERKGAKAAAVARRGASSSGPLSIRIESSKPSSQSERTAQSFPLAFLLSDRAPLPPLSFLRGGKRGEREQSKETRGRGRAAPARVYIILLRASPFSLKRAGDDQTTTL